MGAWLAFKLATDSEAPSRPSGVSDGSQTSHTRTYPLISVTLRLAPKDQAILNIYDKILAVVPGLDEQTT